MTARAKELLRWMMWRGGKTAQLWWSQIRIAKDLSWSVRTVQRYLSELVKLNGVEVVMRGPRSAMYNLCVECGKLLNHGGPFGGPLAVSPISEKTTLKETTAMNAPSCRKRPQAELQLPSPTITNEYGRVDINPEWQRMQEILRGAAGRIASARNPAAYERAILTRELGLRPALEAAQATATGLGVLPTLEDGTRKPPTRSASLYGEKESVLVRKALAANA